jgi:hypothetical protein
MSDTAARRVLTVTGTVLQRRDERERSGAATGVRSIATALADLGDRFLAALRGSSPVLEMLIASARSR